MLEKGLAESEEELREFNRTVVRLGERLGKPVVATGDVHFLNPEDEIYRHILLATKGFDDCDKPNPLYFRTTDEMLKEFSYLGPEKAYEVVVRNPNTIADMCETLRPVPHNLFAPSIENSVEDLKRLVYGKMHRLYGDNPPELITKRVETELGDIIRCHYDVIYMSAQKLVQNSLEHGYLVGSRGSVGSSIVAYMAGITEVNSFPPHYRCPNPDCKFTTFDVPKGYGCGADLPDGVCPKCGSPFEKDGFNIPFETFLGFGQVPLPEIPVDADGAGIICDVEIHHNGIVFRKLLVLCGKYPPGHTHRAHIQSHIPNGNHRVYKGAAKNGLPAGRGRSATLWRGSRCALPGRLRGRRFGKLLHHLPAHFLCLAEEVRPLQLFVGLNLNGDRTAKPVRQVPPDPGNAGFQGLLAIGLELHRQLVPLPGPLASRQRGPGPGILLHKQLHQLLLLHLAERALRKVGKHLHTAHIIQRPEIPAGHIQQPPGHIGGTLQLQKNGPLLHIQLRILNRRLRQQLIQRRGRRILGKHL